MAPLQTPRGTRPRPPCLAALALGLGLCSVAAGAGPAVWGYGVKPCRDFLAAAPGDAAPATLSGAEYLRYREWLAGFITGLNLATAADVLAGAELDAALISIHARCQARPGDDFFNATMNLIRSLGRTKAKGAAGKGAKGKTD